MVFSITPTNAGAMTEQNPETLLRELATLRDSIQELDQSREAKVQRREKILVVLRRAGVPVTRLAAASGVHRSRIYQLLDRSESN